MKVKAVSGVAYNARCDYLNRTIELNVDPTLTRPDKHGRPRPVLVPGPDPLVRPHPEPAEGFSVPAHVDRLVLLGDGDSERVMTSAAMARAIARLARQNLDVSVAMAPEGQDFVDVLTGAA